MASSEDCSGCEQKNIILLGCTQAGKSHFLKSLLSYGGFTEAARKVETGNGNRSKTQKCSSHTYKFELNNHILCLKSTGKPCPASPDHEPDLLSITEQPTYTHVHLNIIDTPGLSDSENDNGMIRLEDVEDPTGSQMASVDERHKISILVSLLQAREIHAVCLMKPKGPYSASLQRYLRYIISIFQISLPHIAWSVHMHVIHTSIYSSERFGSRLKIAKNVFTELFQMDATHHFVDSDPDLDDPQSVYFSKCAVANFLAEMKEQSSFPVTNLKYKKESAHIANDQVLRAAYAELQAVYRGRIDKSADNQQVSKKSKKPLEPRCQLQKTQISEIKTEIASLDTNDRIQVNEDNCEVDRSIPGGNYRFHLTSKTEIAYPVESGHSNGNWEQVSKNSYSYSATLSVPWMEKATAWVKIYSQKRHIEATKISELQKDLKEAEKENSETNSKLQALDKSISEENDNIRGYNKAIEAFDDAMASLHTSSCEIPHFDVSRYGANLKYFTAAGAYAASLGYGLPTKIPTTSLPSACASMDSARSKLHYKRKQLEHTLNVLSVAASKLASRNKLFDASAKHLNRIGNRLDGSFSAIQLDKDEAAASVTSLDDIFTMDSPEGEDPFEERDMHARVDILNGYVTDATIYLDERRAFELERLQEEKTEICRAADELQALYDEAEKLQKTFAAQGKRTNCGIRALDLIEKWLEDGTLPIGAFAVLRQAALDGLKEPWLRLWSDVAEAESVRDYRCGLEK